MPRKEAKSCPPSVTVVTRAFPPAYLGGGPARSLEGLVATLGNQFRFSVITSAYDVSPEAPMAEIITDQWRSTEDGAMVWYSSARLRSLKGMLTALQTSLPDAVYLNSLFDLRFTMIPLLVLRFRRRDIPVLLAPRGELSRGALYEKRYRKTGYLAWFRALRLHRYVDWHASTEIEKADIVRTFGPAARTHIAVNIRVRLSQDRKERAHEHDGSPKSRERRPLVFLSRIARKKNLYGLLRSIALLHGTVDLTIAGPIVDKAYWEECQRLIRSLPSGKTARYVGVISSSDVVTFLEGFELLVLPTFGENFGHVVLEALAAGTPVIVGEDTPWRSVVQVGGGWVCDPADLSGLARQIEYFFRLDDLERIRMRAAALDIARRFDEDHHGVEAARTMLLRVIERASATE
jgi:glycosyltransferase involved in cell wall biosynthesis